MDPSSSPRNWIYDVFPSFSGEDVRTNFLSHFLKELDRKLIIAFKDTEMERSQSLSPELEQAVKDSRIAVVVFSKNYASSSWCLNELLEIMTCQEKFGQIVIPVFYGLDPSHVSKQTEEFGTVFEKTCHNKTDEVITRWRQALTHVANILGYHASTWCNEATMIEAIASEVLGKLLFTPSKDFDNSVGIEDHIAQMSVLLQLESEEVWMVGMWGSSGIGKTTVARALFSRLSRHFQGSIFIDRGFVSKSKETYYSRANPDDHNMKLHLQGNFLSEILGKKDIQIDHLGALGERLKHQKVVIVIDDIDDLAVLDALAGKTQWFGSGSRIILVTNDKSLLMAHEVDHIYKIVLPSEECALEMLCQSAFKQSSPPQGFEMLATEVVRYAGRLPLGLNVLGSSLRGRDKEYWIDILPRLQNGLDAKIEKTLRLSYDGLSNEEDKAIFRHIACLFNGVDVKDFKLLLADSNLCVNIALKNLVDKSLISVRRGKVEMHRLLQEMGRKIVRTQSIDKPGKREFLMDIEDVCYVLTENMGTQKILGISLDTEEIDELLVHENAFKGMRNLRFLEIYLNKHVLGKEYVLQLPKSFDYLPPKLKLLCWQGYPMRCMPSKFCPGNLVKLKMENSKLEKLWEGVVSLTCLKEIDLSGSGNLKEIPDLSMAINLETLILVFCWSLVELSSSIRNLHKLMKLEMQFCKNLETLPTDMNLKSLDCLNLDRCLRLRTFPKISTNISKLFLKETSIEEFPSDLHLENLVELCLTNLKSEKQWEGVQTGSLVTLDKPMHWIRQPFTPFMTMLSPCLTKLWLAEIPTLVELPASLQYLNELKELKIRNCVNMETLPTRINLRSLNTLDLKGCSRLKRFPDISTNISFLILSQTAIQEVPWWIENFSRLQNLIMEKCSKLEHVDLNISKLKHLSIVTFSHCGALIGADLSFYPSGVKMEADSTKLPAPKEASSSLPDNYFPKVKFYFINCFNMDQEALLHQQIVFKILFLSGEEVPSYFTHRSTGNTLTSIPLLQTCLSKPYFRFRACVVLGPSVEPFYAASIKVCCRIRGRLGSHFDIIDQAHNFSVPHSNSTLGIFDCCFTLHKENAPLLHLRYDHVDIQFQGIHLIQNIPLVFNGCGIRLTGDRTPDPNNPNILACVREVNVDNLGGHETESSEEWEDCIDTDLGNESDHCV